VVDLKSSLISYVKNKKNDEYYTPREAILPIIRYLPKEKIYWEPTDFGESEIVKVLREFDFKVISTHIKDGFDFLKDSPNFDFDVIITNPPYSLKTEFLRKCYEYQKPFALLLPITALEGIERGELFRKFGVEVLILDRRVNFSKTEKNVWFNTSWFTYKILPEKLIFEKVG
jgi:hypothetical protein